MLISSPQQGSCRVETVEHTEDVLGVRERKQIILVGCETSKPAVILKPCKTCATANPSDSDTSSATFTDIFESINFFAFLSLHLEKTKLFERCRNSEEKLSIFFIFLY